MFGADGTRRHVRLRRPGPHGRAARRRRQRPYGGWFDEVADVLATCSTRRGIEPGRRGREASSSTAASSRFHVAPRAPRRGLRRCCATTRTCGSSCSPRRQRRALPARTPAASCTPSTTCSRSPTTAGSGSRSRCPDADPHIPSIVVGLPDQRLARARDLGLLRDRLRRPPGADPDRDARRLAGPPAAQGLPARRHPGRVQGRHRSRPPDKRRSYSMTTDRHRCARAHVDDAETEGTPSSAPSGGDWADIAEEAARARRGAHRRQHGPAAPVDPRRAPADPRDRRRDGHRGPARHRLPAHRHREEHGVPHLDPGRHVLHADGLPGAAVPGDGVLPRRSRSCSASPTTSPSGPPSSGC